MTAGTKLAQITPTQPMASRSAPRGLLLQATPP
jgi:hypothetical protein